MKKTIGFLALLVFLLFLSGTAMADAIKIDEAHFPDVALREYVHDWLDGDRDGILSDEERDNITIIEASERGIKSLKGVELFPNLETLNCYSNSITSLAGLNIPSLQALGCSGNPLGVPDVSGFPNLETLYCAQTGMTSLAGLKIPSLIMLDCSENALGALNLSGFPKLEYLRCVNCGLTALDVSGNSRLKELYCQNNRLISLNVSMLKNLTDLTCDGNRLTSLYLEENGQMSNLNCEGNEFSVTAVDGVFDLRNLPGFELIRAQDFTGGTLEGWVLTVEKSEKVFYTYACGMGFSRSFCLDMIVTASQPAQGIAIDDEHFPDSVFRAYVYDNLDTDHDGVLSDAERRAVAKILLNEKRISSLQGLEYFPELELLSCTRCQLSSLDVSVVPGLKILHCSQNQLTKLDVSHNPALTNLECSNNELTSLNLSANPLLQHLSCSANPLGALDLSRNTALEEVWCQNNRLTALDLSHNKELKYLDCYGNFFTTLDISSNQKLTWLQCTDCRLAAGLDASKNAALQTLYGDQRTLVIEADNGKFDLNTFPGFDVSKASNWTVGTVNGHILTVPDVCKVTYDYDCGNGHTISCIIQVNINIVEEPDDPAILGDVNGDGVVDGRDLLRLARYMAGDGVTVDMAAADVNGDGNVDGRDVLRLAKQLAGG